jgi:beta-mannosidase
VNGRPVFAKGANYIPNDNFLPRVNIEKYEEIVGSAAKANMNMLRVWGGGIYENDIFYDLCDKYGILVWQDFMFACSMYPGDDAFLENVYREAVDNVIRLRNHASIALWCGNNEIDGAWCEGDMNCGWGWKQRYTPEQRKEIWHSYDTLFHKILPDIVQTYDGLRDYWPSSPQADWGEHASYRNTSGDMHYWGVWHGKEPFSEFYKVVARFMSEYGFQSFPDLGSVKRFTLPDDWNIDSEVMMAHQRSGLGNRRIVEYMRELYPVPDEFSDLLYVGQVLQAEGIKQAIHAHRAQKPYCMGTLYWQLNDCWPAASWSGIDYYTSWKALHYYAKRAYAPVILAFIPDEDDVIISICSDDPGSRNAQLYYAIKDFEGNTLYEQVLGSKINADKAVIAARLPKEEIFDNYNTREIYLEASLLDGEEILARDIYFFQAAKDLHLPLVEIQTEISEKKGYYEVNLSSNKLARNVYLSMDSCDVNFSDNYFDLLPGETKTVSCKSVNSGKELSSDLQIKVLNDLLDFNQ